MAPPIKSKKNQDQLYIDLQTKILVGALGLVMISSIITLFRLSTSPADVYREVVEVKHDVAKITSNLEDARGSHLLLQSAVNNSDDIIAHVDEGGKILAWSAGAEKFFKTKRGEAIGFGVGFIIPRRFREKHIVEFNKALRSGKKQLYKFSNDCFVIDGNGQEKAAKLDTSYIPELGAVTRIYPKEPANAN